ncbi:hypothetical protein TI39_contig599g00002 [Zymoseptoria brevis]|uniref:Uncharacterized protein n=1 Tax=Zymoseptoria brevis TaxID=1047168 RepID=A0A0F4GIB6_9PEZI|nr:hypothetical protein TI39_contig599g00002 [Zymoseptoria brevis]
MDPSRFYDYSRLWMYNQMPESYDDHEYDRFIIPSRGEIFEWSEQTPMHPHNRPGWTLNNDYFPSQRHIYDQGMMQSNDWMGMQGQRFHDQMRGAGYNYDDAHDGYIGRYPDIFDDSDDEAREAYMGYHFWR